METDCQLSGERGQQRNNSFSQHFCLRESYHSSPSSWSQTIQFISKCLWLLSICCPNAAALSESVYGPFKRKAWDSKNLGSHSATILAGFHNQKFWGLLISAMKPWTGSSFWCGAWTLGSSGVTSTPEITLPTFNSHMWILGQPVLCLCPSYQFHMASFLYS